MDNTRITAVFSAFAGLGAEETTGAAVATLINAAVMRLKARFNREPKSEEITLLELAAASLALSDYLSLCEAGEMIEFTAGDVSVKRSGVNSAKTAMRMYLSAIDALGDLIRSDDTVFLRV